MRKIAFVFLLFILGCQDSSPSLHTSWQPIHDRLGRPLYRAQVPKEWKRLDPLDQTVLSDTTVAVCSFTVDHLKITIHTFPVSRLEERIPPQAQIARWKQQLVDTTEREDARTAQVGHDGFLGIQLHATTMLAWSMQLAPEHFLKLQALAPLDMHYRADYTIKATGPKEEIEKHQPALLAFAESFELIEELPNPL